MTAVSRPPTRTAILDAVDGLLGALGYRKLTIDDVARAAGISRRTFYLLPPGDRETASRLQDLGRLRLIATRRGADLLEWFVDPGRARQGAALYELDVSDAMRERLRVFLHLGEARAAAGETSRRGEAPTARTTP